MKPTLLIICLLFFGCVSSGAPNLSIKNVSKKLLKTDRTCLKELVQINVRPGVKQKILLFTPSKPSHLLVMFPGGDGRLLLSDSGEITENSDDFTVRIIESLVKEDIMVALMDAPDDQLQRPGLSRNSFRTSQTHLQDIENILSSLGNDSDMPIWLLGFSMGNHSSVFAASHLKGKIDGLIICSAITRWSQSFPHFQEVPAGIFSLKLDQITVPVQIFHHQNDACVVCPAQDVSNLQSALVNVPQIEINMVSGGKPQAEACGPLSRHGLQDNEKQVIDNITKFIRSTN